MKRPSEATLRALCEARGVKNETLCYLGGGREDSDGVVYRTEAEGGARAFKVLSLNANDHRALEGVCERLAFIHYLGENGVRIAYPLPNGDGRLFVCLREADTLFLAYETPLAPGENPANDDLTPAFAKAWGALTGKTHRLTQRYPIWKKLDCGESEYGYIDEMRFFENWCRDETVKAHWRALRERLAQTPITRENYGFIHNDNHQRNILAQGTQITLIDFDCAGCNFFMQDMITPMQGLMFEEAGGMLCEVRDADRLRKFYEAFLEGYERERHMEAAELRRADDFVTYRRLLLFTCMQDFWDTQPELKQGMLRMIERGARVLAQA